MPLRQLGRLSAIIWFKEVLSSAFATELFSLQCPSNSSVGLVRSTGSCITCQTGELVFPAKQSKCQSAGSNSQLLIGRAAYLGQIDTLSIFSVSVRFQRRPAYRGFDDAPNKAKLGARKVWFGSPGCIFSYYDWQVMRVGVTIVIRETIREVYDTIIWSTIPKWR